MTTEQFRADCDRRALNGVRAYALSRTRLLTDWTSGMWFEVLMKAADPEFPKAKMVLDWYGISP